MEICEICGTNPADGEIIYDDGEDVVGCADCILEIATDPANPIYRIVEYD